MAAGGRHHQGRQALKSQQLCCCGYRPIWPDAHQRPETGCLRFTSPCPPSSPAHAPAGLCLGRGRGGAAADAVGVDACAFDLAPAFLLTVVEEVGDEDQQQDDCGCGDGDVPTGRVLYVVDHVAHVRDREGRSADQVVEVHG